MGKLTKRRSRSYDLFLIKPGKNSDARTVAKKLLMISKVKEVLITEGDYGFIVKAQTQQDKDKESLNKEIYNVVGGSSRKSICYCEYRK